MHHLLMKNMGPVKYCDMDIDEFTVLTGAQASGKSTIAKSIFFFKTIKDDILDCMVRRSVSINNDISLYKTVANLERKKFLQIFGTSRAMDSDLSLLYTYDTNTYVKITLKLKKGDDYISPNYVFFEYSKNIESFFKKYNNYHEEDNLNWKNVKNELDSLFSDDFETIFIPAGRSLITLLTTQLNYLFTVMDEEQRHSIDFCTQKYIERILKIRNSFEEGALGYLEKKRTTSIDSFDNRLASSAVNLVDHILKGRYKYVSGEERLVINDGKYVKINYTSSGQQESVWIFNILLYQLINNTKTYIILEEPEAHLYPDAQKEITELLSLFMSNGNSVLITTHSPYILGAINNLLFAKSIINTNNESRIYEVVKKEIVLSKCSSYYLDEGNIYDCFDSEIGLIKNEVIDGASNDINEVFDKLIDINNEEIV